MTIYAPYFYIIQDRRNGMYYAGSKYSKKKSQRTNPIHFMTEDGYQTSSSVIRTIIDLYVPEKTHTKSFRSRSVSLLCCLFTRSIPD